MTKLTIGAFLAFVLGRDGAGDRARLSLLALHACHAAHIAAGLAETAGDPTAWQMAMGDMRQATQKALDAAMNHASFALRDAGYYGERGAALMDAATSHPALQREAALRGFEAST